MEGTEGFLLKRGSWRKSWKRRWFVLREGSVLDYYESMEASVDQSAAKGSIDLVGSDVQQFSTLSGEDAAVKEAKEAGYQIECGLAIRTLKRTCVRRPA